MASLMTRKRLILAKTETTYGVDSVPTGSANAMLVRNLTVNPINATTVSRDVIRPYLGNSDTLIAERHVTADFEIELQGSGTAGTAPAWGPLLEACAFSKTIVATTSVTYAPQSNTFPSLTIYYNVDGLLHSITGARGTVELSLTVKQIPVLKFKFMGIYNPPSDVAAPTVDFTQFQVPKVVNTANSSAFSIYGYSGYLESVNLNLANDVQYRTLVGYEAVNVVDRKPSGTFVIEAPHISVKDFFTLANNGTTGAMSVTHGAVAGDIVTLAAPRITLGNLTYSDTQGVQMLNLPFVASPVTGNDELTIVLT